MFGTFNDAEPRLPIGSFYRLNAASLRVVEKLGLRREGFYERFLDIDGAWRDHVAFAVTVEELDGRSLLSRLPALPSPRPGR